VLDPAQEGFAEPVEPGGYAWWYFDALSDDGERALTTIFFRGSVFSPDYAKRMRAGGASADEHLGVNLALYDRGRQVAWVMSEYGARELHRADDGGLTIARSTLDGRGVTIDDRSAPFFASLARLGSAVRGTVELEPLAPAIGEASLTGSDGKRHRWHVPSPRARVKVRFERPRFSFDGIGYHDVNRGDGRLEDAFARWSWARFHPRDDERRTLVLYSVRDRAGGQRALLVDTGEGGPAHAVDGREGPSRDAGWGLSVPRWFDAGGFRCEPGELLERAPFYARYRAGLSRDGVTLATGLGEHLDLDRFRGRGVQFLLRFKTRKVS
jgi:carotenoid 1,2-hydratase